MIKQPVPDLEALPLEISRLDIPGAQAVTDHCWQGFVELMAESPGANAKIAAVIAEELVDYMKTWIPEGYDAIWAEEQFRLVRESVD